MPLAPSEVTPIAWTKEKEGEIEHRKRATLGCSFTLPSFIKGLVLSHFNINLLLYKYLAVDQTRVLERVHIGDIVGLLHIQIFIEILVVRILLSSTLDLPHLPHLPPTS